MNKFTYFFPSDYQRNYDIYADALNECQKYCMNMTFDFSYDPFDKKPFMLYPRSKNKVIFESDTFESLIVIYCIMKKAEMEADQR